MFRRRIYLVFKIHERFAIETVHNNTCSSRHTGLGFADFAGQTWLAGFWSPTCGLAAQFTGNMWVSCPWCSLIFHECLDLRHAETTKQRYSCSVNVLPIVEWHRIFPTCKQRSAVIPMFAQQSSGDHRNSLQKSVFHVVFRYTHFSTFKLQGSLCYPMFWFISLIVSQPRNPVGQVKLTATIQDDPSIPLCLLRRRQHLFSALRSPKS